MLCGGLISGPLCEAHLETLSQFPLFSSSLFIIYQGTVSRPNYFIITIQVKNLPYLLMWTSPILDEPHKSPNVFFVLFQLLPLFFFTFFIEHIIIFHVGLFKLVALHAKASNLLHKLQSQWTWNMTSFDKEVTFPSWQ